MKLLFCYLAEKIVVDEKKRLYTSGNFTPEVWNRYLALTDDLHVLMTILPRGSKSDDLQKSHQLVDKQKIKIHPVPYNAGSLKDYFSPALNRERENIIEKAIRKADAVIIRSPEKLLVDLCRKHDKPYVVEVVGCVRDALWNHSLKGKILAPFMFFEVKKIIKESTYVLYVTNQFLQKRYPTNGHMLACSDVSIDYVEEGILKERIKRIEETDKKRKIIIGTAAALHVKYKGQKYVIKALAELKKNGMKNFEYQLVGGGDPSLLLREVKKYGLEDQVKIIGQLNHDKVFEWLQTIDIYIQPSLLEGMPRSVIEAMSYGVPCLGAEVGGIPELLNKEMLFKKKNYKQIAEILKSLTRNTMKSEAKRNYTFAKQYEYEKLKKSRQLFYESFILNEVNK